MPEDKPERVNDQGPEEEFKDTMNQMKRELGLPID